MSAEKARDAALIALDEARAAAQVQADEIARLKSDEYHRTRDALIETLRKERDEARARERLHREARDAALLDLSQARAELHAMTGAAMAREEKRNAAVARAEAAEASAAAMREALQFVDGQAEFYQHGHTNNLQLCAMRSRVKEELAGDAGRALLDRHAAELAQLRATVAASEAQTVDYAGRLGAADDVLAQLREELHRAREARDAAVRIGNRYQTQLQATDALLGKAVAALRDAFIRNEPCGSCDMCGSKRTRDEHHIGDCILADPNATAAADAYRAQQEVLEASKAFRVSGVPHEHWVRMWDALDALAKVDARRGRGGR